MKMRLNNLALACVMAGSTLLVACGGGGDSVSVLTVKGTAAIGQPLVGAVTAKCKSGTGSATSDAEGMFTVVVENAVVPCLLSVSANGTTLYSVSSGSSATQVANITSMTNLMVNYFSKVPGMSAPNPADWFALPTTQALLVDTTALNSRIVNDFVPAVKSIAPTVSFESLAAAQFLYVAYFAKTSPSPTDADLERMMAAALVTATGAPAPTTTDALTTAASNDTPVVSPTGAGS